MRALFLSCFFLLLVGNGAADALTFPPLTGRVVDDAHILSPATTQSLDQRLAEYENGTTNQVVVVTLPSLQGTSIEDYGYQLGRAWQIGQKGKNNGVLLIIAPHERQVRIEVGYGLEGTLTDAISSEIVHGIILPKFRTGDMQEGIVEGTKAILDVLGGQSMPSHGQNASANSSVAWLFMILILWIFLWRVFGSTGLATYYLMGSAMRIGGSRMGGSAWGGGGFGGGGFSGGGGSFGGGGASGGW